MFRIGRQSRDHVGNATKEIQFPSTSLEEANMRQAFRLALAGIVATALTAGQVRAGEWGWSGDPYPIGYYVQPVYRSALQPVQIRCHVVELVNQGQFYSDEATIPVWSCERGTVYEVRVRTYPCCGHGAYWLTSFPRP
jgi:hypothetical protein